MSERNTFATETATTFTPFWHKFPSFLLYPLQIGTIIRLTLLTLIYVILRNLASAIGEQASFFLDGVSGISEIPVYMPDTINAWLRTILWVMFLKYAFEIMERTSNGRFDEPNGTSSNDDYLSQVIKQYSLFIIILLIIDILNEIFGDIGFDLGLLLMEYVAPASIMIIAVNRNLRDALNPAKILFYIRSIGSSYFALCLTISFLTSNGMWLRRFVYDNISLWISVPLIAFVKFYFILIFYHMIGYVIYQYHEKLGIDAEVSFEKAKKKASPNTTSSELSSQLSELIVDGHFDTAIDLLREELRLHWENNDLHERYQKLLLAAGKNTLAIQHAREFIAKLVIEKRIFKALDLCEQSLKIDPEFKLQDSYQLYELASAARLAKRGKLALELMRDFDKKYPEHPHIPQIYLLSAQLLSEHFQQHNEAMQLLQRLQSTFPEHALYSEAGQYMKAVTKLSAIS